MDRLWAPWRMSYLDQIGSDASRPGACFLCAARDARDDREALVFLRRKRAFAMLNRFPYNNGHTLIVPHDHKGELADLGDETLLEILTLTRDVLGLLRRFMRPDGFNVGLNVGRVAGAGLPEHLHFHVVPRWSGDTNFMPVLGETKVIPQSLDELYDQVCRAAAGDEPAAGTRSQP